MRVPRDHWFVCLFYIFLNILQRCTKSRKSEVDVIERISYSNQRSRHALEKVGALFCSSTRKAQALASSRWPTSGSSACRTALHFVLDISRMGLAVQRSVALLVLAVVMVPSVATAAVTVSTPSPPLSAFIATQQFQPCYNVSMLPSLLDGAIQSARLGTTSFKFALRADMDQVYPLNNDGDNAWPANPASLADLLKVRRAHAHDRSPCSDRGFALPLYHVKTRSHACAHMWHTRKPLLTSTRVYYMCMRVIWNTACWAH
jgi:hypothetical protein